MPALRQPLHAQIDETPDTEWTTNHGVQDDRFVGGAAGGVKVEDILLGEIIFLISLPILGENCHFHASVPVERRRPVSDHDLVAVFADQGNGLGVDSLPDTAVTNSGWRARICRDQNIPGVLRSLAADLGE